MNDSGAAPEPPPTTSLMSRMANIYPAPDEVMREVAASKRSSGNWLVPLLLWMIAGVAYVWIAFSQPAVLQNLQEAQREKFRERVAAGKMTEEAAAQAEVATARFMRPGLVKLFSTIGALVGSAAMLFLTAWGLWLLSRLVFKRRVGYGKALEVTGMAAMITVLGSVAAIPLVVLKGSLFANLGPVLLLDPIEQGNKVHAALSSLNFFSLWYLAVLACGEARLAEVSFWKAAAWLFGAWALIKSGGLLFV